MSNGQVLSFLRRPSSCDWTQQELAEFYRVEDLLFRGGLAFTTDSGVSDRGDPWFVVCRADTEEVIAHFARIDREYVIVTNLYPGAARGGDFRALVCEVLESHSLTMPIRRKQR
jgi:collagen type I alpha